MVATNTTDTDIAALRDDLLGLKRDVAELLGHVGSDAAAGARGAAGRIGDEAQSLLADVTAKGKCSANAVAGQIEAQPLVALLIAVGIGYVGGRLLSR
jgi:hypothetical protein